MVRPRLAVGLLCLCWGAVYLPAVVGGRTLPARDVAATHIPWRLEWRAQVLAGAVPIWEPSSNQGRPLLANPNAMAAYPGSLLFLVLPPEAAAAWHIAIHHLLLLLGCWALARRSGAGAGAAAVAAAATATCGVAWSTVTLLNTQASLVWSVWALAAVLPPPAPGAGLRRAAIGGALLGLAFLGGEPVVAALAAVAWTVVVMALWRPLPKAALALATVVAIAVAAPVLAPLVGLYGETVRGALGVPPGAVAADALAARRLPELLLPRLLGSPLGDADSGFWAAPSFPWQRYFPLVFLGSLPLLALARARGDRRLWPWWALLLLGVAGAMALGIPAVAARAAAVPGLGSARYGIKLLLLAMMALPPLIADGYRRLIAAGTARRRGAIAALAVCLALAAAALSPAAVRATLARLYPRSAEALVRVGDAEIRRTITIDAAALALPVALLAATGAAAPLAVAVFAAQTVAGAGVLTFDHAARWESPPALVAELPAGVRLAALAGRAAPPDHAGRAALARFWSPRAALFPDYGRRWGFSYSLARGPDGLEPILQELLAAEAARLNAAGRARVARAVGAHATITDEPVDRLHSRPVDGVWVTVLDAPAPAAYLARRLLPCDGIPAAVRTLASEAFAPGRDATVAGTGGVITLQGGTVVASGGPPHHRRFSVASGGRGLLVVQQSFMRCWRARVDGAPAPVEVANGAMLGVSVPAGTHEVELFVDPTPYRLGALGPPLVLLGFVLASPVARRWRSRLRRGLVE